MSYRNDVLDRLDAIRGRHQSRMDASAKMAYGIAKSMGIDTTGMSPKEVWEAINKNGGVPGGKAAGTSKQEKPKANERNRSQRATPRTRVQSAQKAEADHVLGRGYSKEAQKAYDDCREREKEITPDVLYIADQAGLTMSGLEYSCKTASSVADKIERTKKSDAKRGIQRSDDQIVNDFWDIVRYTGVGEHKDLVKQTNDVVKAFEDNGYSILEINNKYLTADQDNPYKGIHLAVQAPNGQIFEYQIHSKESLDVKNKLHGMYEEQRNVNTSKERANELIALQWQISQKLKNPDGIETLKNYRRG